MCDAKKTPMYRALAFKLPYYMAAALFAYLCAVGSVLLFSRSPSKVLSIAVGLVYFAVFLLVSAHVDRKKTKKSELFFSLTGAFICTYGFSLYMEPQKSLIWLIIYGFAAFFLSGCVKRESGRRCRAASSVLGWLFALFVFLGYQLETHGKFQSMYTLSSGDLYSLARELISLVGLALFFLCVLDALFALILERDFSSDKGQRTAKGDAAFVFAVFFGILVCWLPYYIAFFPGTMSPDSMSEMRQQMGLETLSNHHPYMHQLIIALALRLSGGSAQNGVGIYSAIQMLLLASCFAFCVYFLRRLGANKAIQLSALAFFALYPVNPLFAMAMWKDVPFGAICLVFMLLLIHENKKETESKKQQTLSAALLVLVGFLFCTLRNNGWYSFLLGFPLYIIFSRKDFKKRVAVFFAVIVLVSAYNHVIFDVMGIKKSAAGEALSIPLQQIARTVTNNPESLQTEEVQVLREVFPDIEVLKDRYDPVISDRVKDPHIFLSEVFTEDPVRYLKSWAGLGMKYPATYIDALLMQNYGYWYPDVTYLIVNSSLNPNELGISQLDKFSDMRNELERNFVILSTMSPLSVFFSMGLAVWLMALAAVILILKGHGRTASALFVLAALWLTTLASPVYCEYRYLYGLVVCVPLFVGLALGMKNIRQ